MPKFQVNPEKENALITEMKRLVIKEEELIESFIKGSGSGGQKINKTSSCVYLKHIPTGIEIKCQKTRSQSLNRYYARKELCEKIAARILGEATKKQQEKEKIRRQKKRRTRKQKEKILENKSKRSEIKASRKKPENYD